jgi:hypothetical protein
MRPRSSPLPLPEEAGERVGCYADLENVGRGYAPRIVEHGVNEKSRPLVVDDQGCVAETHPGMVIDGLGLQFTTRDTNGERKSRTSFYGRSRFCEIE